MRKPIFGLQGKFLSLTILVGALIPGYASADGPIWPNFEESAACIRFLRGYSGAHKPEVGQSHLYVDWNQESGTDGVSSTFYLKSTPEKGLPGFFVFTPTSSFFLPIKLTSVNRTIGGTNRLGPDVEETQSYCVNARFPDEKKDRFLVAEKINTRAETNYTLGTSEWIRMDSNTRGFSRYESCTFDNMQTSKWLPIPEAAKKQLQSELAQTIHVLAARNEAAYTKYLATGNTYTSDDVPALESCLKVTTSPADRASLSLTLVAAKRAQERRQMGWIIDPDAKLNRKVANKPK